MSEQPPIAEKDAAFTKSCQPSGCSCIGHRWPGVRHMVPCCDAPHMDQVTCDAAEDGSGARCHKSAGHDGPHNGWAHYPGQLVSWDVRVTSPGGPDA